METVLQLLRDHGPAVYSILFLYCALKSGALPLFGGYAAQQGVLDPVWVASAAFAGGYLGDEARFALARRCGESFMVERPRLAWCSPCAAMGDQLRLNCPLGSCVAHRPHIVVNPPPYPGDFRTR